MSSLFLLWAVEFSISLFKNGAFNRLDFQAQALNDLDSNIKPHQIYNRMGLIPFKIHKQNCGSRININPLIGESCIISRSIFIFA
jgi:hypothetical protein